MIVFSRIPLRRTNATGMFAYRCTGRSADTNTAHDAFPHVAV